MNNTVLLLPIFVPILFAIVVLFRKDISWKIALSVSMVNVILSTFIYLSGPLSSSYGLGDIGISFGLRAYSLSSFALLAISLFTLIIVIYSAKHILVSGNYAAYHSNILLTLGAASGAVLSSNLILFLVFWGMTGFTTYQLIDSDGRAALAAKKAFIVLGGTDALMIFGIAVVWVLARTFDMGSIKLSLDSLLPVLAYFAIASAALAKSGAVPFHSWITDSSVAAPLPVMAYLPAALDKILGVYLLFRLSTDMFVVYPNSFVSNALLAIGSVTIIIAVMAALVQHNLKKLLAYHSVSQFGYMIMGIGTGIPIGIAGALFHMLNNTIYKTCLFLCGGAVEKEAGTTELDRLGGLAALMPVTFASMMIASLAISGIPPFNGFVSKWMIYQGLVMLGIEGCPFWMIYLAAAMFGSALTLASFMKIMNAVFLGPRPARHVKEAPPSMIWPSLILAAVCFGFGVLAFQVPLKLFILPSVPHDLLFGAWSPMLATSLIAVGLLIGMLIFIFSRKMRLKVSPAFIGGESIPSGKLRISGVNFYNTVKDVGILKRAYGRSEAGAFDMYSALRRASFFVSGALKTAHSGLLRTYMLWCLVGLVALLIIFFRGA
jgi:formate hydrogenlyase subunit 3/multisubunit Na+/H+ antiporter MnhD subunit